MNEYLPNFSDDLNHIKVESDDLISAMRTVHELPPERCDVEGRMIAIHHLFGGCSPHKCQAIYYRITALSKIIASGDLPHFASPENADGSVWIQGIVVSAAVNEPLLFRKNEAYFDPEGFRDRVLALAAPDCHA